MDRPNPLRRLAELERRYDGPVPIEARRLVLDGAAEAAAQSLLFDRLARHAVQALARARNLIGHRPAGGAPEMSARIAADLRLYRQAGIAWRDKIES